MGFFLLSITLPTLLLISVMRVYRVFCYRAKAGNTTWSGHQSITYTSFTFSPIPRDNLKPWIDTHIYIKSRKNRKFTQENHKKLLTFLTPENKLKRNESTLVNPPVTHLWTAALVSGPVFLQWPQQQSHLCAEPGEGKRESSTTLTVARAKTPRCLFNAALALCRSEIEHGSVILGVCSQRLNTSEPSACVASSASHRISNSSCEWHYCSHGPRGRLHLFFLSSYCTCGVHWDLLTNSIKCVTSPLALRQSSFAVELLGNKMPPKAELLFLKTTSGFSLLQE